LLKALATQATLELNMRVKRLSEIEGIKATRDLLIKVGQSI
jgi:hypothetical protein